MKENGVFIIAEAGVNHNGSLEMAKQLARAARDAGASAVKFQTFRAEAVISAHTQKAAYQKQTTGTDESQLEMVRKLELSFDEHKALHRYCADIGIRYLSAPFDLDSADFLINELDLQLIKLPSGEITNAPLLLYVARSGRPVILSTGMSTLGDIEEALGVLAFGYGGGKAPSRAAFREAWSNPKTRQSLQSKVTLLHCTTEYPTPFSDVHLPAIELLEVAFGLPAGYSDHTLGIAVPIAAAARGAKVIEKHFTLDKTLPGPDHAASLEPEELAAMTRAIREVEQAMRPGPKVPAPTEAATARVVRKSLVAALAIRKGETFSEKNLTAKRSAEGLSPIHYWDLLGRAAHRNYAVDEGISEDEKLS